MLNDLMELFRSEGGGISLDLCSTPPRSLLESVRSTFLLQAERQGIRLELADPEDLPEISVDPRQVDRILSNLVGNALKFTPSGGTVSLEASVAEGAGVDLGMRWLMISVTDTGRGIPPEQLPYVFDPYRQVSRGDAHLGFGLGLAIVQRLMAAHKGRITLRSQVGVGTTFSLFFPLTATPSASPALP
jgi:signal transduction histidine kinase